jgi:hypothetical protein
MVSHALTENFLKILNYCRTQKNKAQINRKFASDDPSTEAYLAILLRQNLLVPIVNQYSTSESGLSYLKSRNRLEIACGNSF